jgi:hypothetical protein
MQPGSPKRWKFSQGYKNNMRFELSYSNRENIMNKYGVNGERKHKLAALIAN